MGPTCAAPPPQAPGPRGRSLRHRSGAATPMLRVAMKSNGFSEIQVIFAELTNIAAALG